MLRHKSGGIPLHTFRPSSSFHYAACVAQPSPLVGAPVYLLCPLIRGNHHQYVRYASAAARPRCFYDLMGLTKAASEEDIKSAYYEKAKQYHPDVNKDAHAQRRFVEITEAYKVLSDKKKRKEYDLERSYGQHWAHGPEPWSRYGGVNGLYEDEDDDLYDFDDADVEYMVHESGAPYGGKKKKKGGKGQQHQQGPFTDEDILMQFISQMGGFTFERGFGKQSPNHNSSGGGFNTRRRESMYQQNQKAREQQHQHKQEKNYSRDNNTNNNNKGSRKNADAVHNNSYNSNNNSNSYNSKSASGGKAKTRGRGKRPFKAYRIIIE